MTLSKASAEARGILKDAPMILTDNEALRLECLTLAIDAEPHDAVTAAQRYYDFVKGIDRKAEVKGPSYTFAAPNVKFTIPPAEAP